MPKAHDSGHKAQGAGHTAHGARATGRLALAASACLYMAVTAWLGRDVLAHLATGIANDAGDPLLTAAILHWNARVLPLSHAWWQFPIFYPTTDALALSEHLLGLSVVATPISWLTNDAAVTYNIVMLLTFPLCALAMYALVHRLNGSAAGACVAGLAYGFSPYRIAQIAHIQMLAAFWAPLSLLGLQGYLESGKRRWLVLYGTAWLLQAAANGYALLSFSVLVGLWVLWFSAAHRRWRACLEIAVATALACVPLIPILYTYVTVHARHGFERGLAEIQFFSADVVAVLCAPSSLTFWGWLRTACRQEGELFPGAALCLLAIAGVGLLVGWLGAPNAPATPRGVSAARRVSLVIAAASGVAVLVGLVVGRWRLEWGPLEITSSSVARPTLVAAAALLVALLTTRGILRAARRWSTLGFYLLTAFLTWSLALGPTVSIAGTRSTHSGPFALMMLLPGGDSLRVPARFWLMTTLCLAVVAGLVVPALTRGRSRALAATLLVVMSSAVLADGWVDRIASAPLPPPVPNAAVLQGKIVLSLPAGELRDVVPQYQAAVGGWTSVNGYSGYEPSYYGALQYGVAEELDEVFEPFRAGHDLHVIVSADAARLTALVERQPDASLIARSQSHVQYLLPRRPVPAPVSGRTLRIQSVDASCSGAIVSHAIDGDPVTRWQCGRPQAGDEVMTVDLGGTMSVGAVRNGLGPYTNDFPRELVIETSLDAAAWQEAWKGRTVARAIFAGIDQPKWPSPAFSFDPRPARYLRLRQTGSDRRFYWSVAEIEVLGGT